MLGPCVNSAAEIAAYSAGSRSASSPCHALSRSESVQESLNTASAASDPMGAS